MSSPCRKSPTAWRPKLKAIEARYPYNLYCPNRSHIGGVAILSRRPFALGTTPQCCRQSDRPGTHRFRRTQRHHYRPPSRLAVAICAKTENVETIKPYFERLQGPLIIAGDFNATSWSQTLKTITVASKTRSAEGLRPSWLVNGTLAHAARWVGLPIDHILVSERISKPGSKHSRLAARIICRCCCAFRSAA